MFGALSDKLQSVFAKLKGATRLTPENIEQAADDVRVALLEADVAFSVTKTFVKRVKEKAVGADVVKSVSPGQQFIKIVHDELVTLLGGGEARLELAGRPAVVMVCGLQGSGKTTSCAKLSRYLQKGKNPKKVLLAACDLQRPAAVDQLKTLGVQAGVSVFSLDGEKNPLKVAEEALKQAKFENYDVLVLDTAGRLHVDEPLMDELIAIKRLTKPSEVLFVANSTTGQDAVKSAGTMHERVGITGVVLTMLDGDARGGAAISIREVTGAPLKFEGIGERLDDIQLFHAVSMADRILGMGDTINLVKRAQEHVDEDEAKALEKKLRKATFTYADYLSQFEKLEKLGSLKGLLKMLPMGDKLGDLEGIDKKFVRLKAIIQSMNTTERSGEVELDMSRRRRISRGSGTSLDEVNKLVKSFKQAKLLFKQSGKMKGLQKMMGGSAWH